MLFIIDTVALVVITFALYDSPMGKLVDFLLHIWAIVELIQAVWAAKKLRRFPSRRNPERLYNRNSSFIHAGSSLEKEGAS